MGREELFEILRDHREEMRRCFRVSSLRVFGSIARDEASECSDVDLLVDFIETPRFREFMDLRIYLEDLLGREVDLITESGLRDRVRTSVEEDAIRVA